MQGDWAGISITMHKILKLHQPQLILWCRWANLLIMIYPLLLREVNIERNWEKNKICSDGVDCCGNFRDTRSICAPIDILRQDFDEDDIYNSFKKGSTTLQRLQTCIPFARSLQNCESAVERKREQFNSLTAFLDLSSVYGNEPFVTKGRGQIEKKGVKFFFIWKFF